MDGGHDWGIALGMGWWWILGLILVVLLVWSIVNANSRKRNSNSDNSPMDILKSRYARGEIDKEEFEKKKSELM